ncbi:fasciclin domain-containing protein [Salinimicrobium tongyeongense]|uniref:Fasciclin domain-containing protein n=1 Tax=Salinimicrobium tongyeongense TaxID=2809707 RepID=A0ABY6NNF0_9FLAO|nr:fasciclin domain-containing protein [Salinimicrobium tongyeongense]UZH54417.1 fasciclin domain-containing protein [Salinimicrobium tongyeongense]
MIYKLPKILIIFLFAGLISCQNNENKSDSETDILPAEEKKDELNSPDRPMPRSYMLARMREDDELTAFTEEFERSGLEEEFKGKEGIYTIFAPSNAAYDRIPARQMNPDNDSLRSNANLMRYYMVEGEMTVDYLRERIRASENDRYEFRTALGEKLWASLEGDKIVLTDVLGNKASIVTSNMDEYYGVYHIIDNVLQPGENGE